jgi:hypothetical protein
MTIANTRQCRRPDLEEKRDAYICSPTASWGMPPIPCFVQSGIAAQVHDGERGPHHRNSRKVNERFQCQERGGPRCRLSEGTSCGEGTTLTAAKVRADNSAKLGVDATPSAELPWLVIACECPKGQQGAGDRKPSEDTGAVQWCWPDRRQHAGGEVCACSRGRPNPASNIASSRLATGRRMSRGIVLHHKRV